jgi:crossover junction endodeoxyribonuclease RuvC
MARVLGIDPGSRVTGYGVVEGDWGQARSVTYGTFRLGDGAFGARLADLHRGLVELIGTWRVDSVAVERVFVNKNVDSALKLGHARGVVLMTVEEAGLPLAEYAPAQIKRSITGSGRAEKSQMQAMVQAILGLPEVPAEDAADALAIAMTHQMLGGAKALIQEAVEAEDAAIAAWRAASKGRRR